MIISISQNTTTKFVPIIPFIPVGPRTRRDQIQEGGGNPSDEEEDGKGAGGLSPEAQRWEVTEIVYFKQVL